MNTIYNKNIFYCPSWPTQGGHL